MPTQPPITPSQPRPSPLSGSVSNYTSQYQQGTVHGYGHKRPHGGSVAFRKSVAINAANLTMGYSQTSSACPSGPSALASQLGASNMQSQASYNPNVYNPSMGPGSSASSQNGKRQRNASGYTSNNSRRINNGICKMSGRTRRSYLRGHIISLPFHTANTNPNVDPQTDKRWTQTVEGPAYSKRRMLVVMWIHEEDMFCLPLYTFSGTGLRKKPRYLRHEYVSMKNWDDENFVNQGDYPAVVADTNRPLHKDTTVHLTGGVKVASNEDISFAGRMLRNSFFDLMELWRDQTIKAREEPW